MAGKIGLVIQGLSTMLRPIPQDDEETPEDGGGAGSSSEDAEEPEDEEEPGGSGEASESEEEDMESEDGDSSASGEEEPQDSAEEEGSGSGSSPENTDEDADGDPEDTDGDSDEGETAPGDASTDGGETDEDSGEDSDGEESPTDKDPKGAGGHSDEELDGIAQELLESILSGEDSGLLDNNSALKDALGGEEEEEEEDLEDDEKVWRPFDPDRDEVKVPSITPSGKNKAELLRARAKRETAALRNRMRSKFLQARRPKTTHGVRNGQDLSQRRLVDSVVEIRSGRRPTRPDWRREKKRDVTLAAAVVVDESWSMEGAEIVNATMGSLVVADSLDTLGSPCLVVGPRNGGRDYDRAGHTHSLEWGAMGGEDASRYHRDDGVIIDVFKDWEESMTRAWPRFGRIQANGGTPLSDGIQYALQELQYREERFRVVLVMTDGLPNCPAVVKRQIRLAAKAGVYIVGVGIGSATRRGVEGLFPLRVVVDRLGDLPQALMGVLEGIVFPKRGKTLRLEGKITARKKGA